MTRRLAALAAAGVVGLTASCQDFLDVNTNPNAPEDRGGEPVPGADAPLDGDVAAVRTAGSSAEYTQQWICPATRCRHVDIAWATTRRATTAAQLWRDVYWSLGQNLIDMMDERRARRSAGTSSASATRSRRGAGYALTDLHGEIIVSEAFDQSKFTFDYDTQEFAYEEDPAHSRQRDRATCGAPTAPSIADLPGRRRQDVQRRPDQVAEVRARPHAHHAEPLHATRRRTTRRP